MKIKDIVQESVYDWFTQRSAARDQASNQQDSRNKTYAKATANIGPKMSPPAPPAGSSDFAKMFKVIDQDPITIQWKQEVFQRKDGTGQWVNFPGGKPIPQAMIVALDKVSPPATVAKPSATPTHGGVTVISVTDNAGTVWTKDEDNNRWLNDAGTVATPDNATKLEKLALTQYQARQMGA